jgi:hypothetical protein
MAGDTIMPYIVNLKSNAEEAPESMAVDGSDTTIAFSVNAESTYSIEVCMLVLLAEFNHSFEIGDHFISENMAGLTTGLLVEAQLDDIVYDIGTFKTTKDLIKNSHMTATPTIITGQNGALVQFFLLLPEIARLRKGSEDYIKATVRDDLTYFSNLEMYIQTK